MLKPINKNTLNLYRLYWIKIFTVVSQLSALLLCYYQFQLPFNYLLASSVLALQVAGLVVIFFRIRVKHSISQKELLFHLIADISCLSLFVFFTGGAANPFISYLLLPIVIGALTLNRWHNAIISILALMVYSVLVFSNHNMTDYHQVDLPINLHLAGMWLTFVLSTVLIAYFVTRMAETLVVQQRQINQLREKGLMEQQVLSVASLAAGTAHKLSTPLNSVSVLADNLLSGNSNPQEHESIQEIQDQIKRCKMILSELREVAQTTRSVPQPVLINLYTRKIIDNWLVRRSLPAIDIIIQLEDKITTLEIDQGYEQALCNLLDNAARYAVKTITISSATQENYWLLTIKDDGKGFDDEVLKNYGKNLLDSQKGLGLGLLITQANVMRLNGEMRLFNRQGAVAELCFLLGDTHES